MCLVQSSPVQSSPAQSSTVCFSPAQISPSQSIASPASGILDYYEYSSSLVPVLEPGGPGSGGGPPCCSLASVLLL
eukprot:scaffold256160_cov16-Prasinocladus_malaysianus.AAC.1